jgi:hypothetical protein
MKTLKTISSALTVALLVSTVPASAMQTVKNVASKAVTTAQFVGALGKAAVKDSANFANAKVFGNGESNTGVRGFNKFANSSALTRTAVALTPVVLVAGGLYAGYKYFFPAVEATESDEGTDVTASVTPEVAVEEAVVEAEVTVEAPKAESKPVRKPKMGARKMAKSPKARAAATRTANRGGCKGGTCGVRRSK